MRRFRRLATPGRSGARPAPLRPPLPARHRRRASGVGRADRGTRRPAPAIRIPEDLGPAGSRGLVGQQEGGAAPLASVGTEGGPPASQSQAASAARAGRQRLPPPPLARERRRLDMGLYLRPYQ